MVIKEAMRMAEGSFFLGLKERDVASAILTSSVITHSYEVETTRHIVTLWSDLRENLELKDENAVVAALLANGRILDIQEDIHGAENVVNIVKTIYGKVGSEGALPEPFTHISYNAALLASAVIAKSSEIETTKSMIDIYREILDLIKPVGNDPKVRSLGAVLCWGRILEQKGRYGSLKEIADTYRYICTELEKATDGTRVSFNEFGAGFMASAYVEISPKVERIRDIIETWDILRWEVEIGDEARYLSSILAAGRVRDMSASELSLPKSSIQLINQIEGLLKAIFTP